MARVVVVALVERHVPLACGVVKGAVPGRAGCGAAQDHAVEALLRVAEAHYVCIHDTSGGTHTLHRYTLVAYSLCLPALQA